MKTITLIVLLMVASFGWAEEYTHEEYIKKFGNEKCMSSDNDTFFIFSLPSSNNEKVEFRFKYSTRPINKDSKIYYTNWETCYYTDSKTIRYCRVKAVLDEICIRPVLKFFYNREED